MQMVNNLKKKKICSPPRPTQPHANSSRDDTFTAGKEIYQISLSLSLSLSI